MSKQRDIISSCERNEKIKQLEVTADEQKIRNSIGKNKAIIGYAEKGFFNILDENEASGEIWYRINENAWIAFNKETMNIVEAKKEEPEKLDLTTASEEELPQDISDLISILDLSLSNMMIDTNSDYIEDIKELPAVGDTIIAKGRVFGSFIGTAPMNSLQDEKVIIKEIKDLKNQSPFAINNLNGEFLGWIEEKTIKSIERGNE